MAYKSKYYDPVKAHNYYMEYTKKGKLKGRGKGNRNSMAGLSDEGKSIAKSVKDSLNAEKKEALEKLKTEMQDRINALKERIKAIKGLSPDDILANGDTAESLKAEIEQLRADLKEKRQKIRDDYKEKYMEELDKLKADKQYERPKKRKKSTKTKKRKENAK